MTDVPTTPSMTQWHRGEEVEIVAPSFQLQLEAENGRFSPSFLMTCICAYASKAQRWYRVVHETLRMRSSRPKAVKREIVAVRQSINALWRVPLTRGNTERRSRTPFCLDLRFIIFKSVFCLQSHLS
jgi:hypothetical protein